MISEAQIIFWEMKFVYQPRYLKNYSASAIVALSIAIDQQNAIHQNDLFLSLPEPTTPPTTPPPLIILEWHLARSVVRRSSAGNDTQKVGGQSTYISVANRSLPSTRLIGELLPRFRGNRMFSSAKQLNNSRKGNQTGKKTHVIYQLHYHQKISPIMVYYSLKRDPESMGSTVGKGSVSSSMMKGRLFCRCSKERVWRRRWWSCFVSLSCPLSRGREWGVDKVSTTVGRS